MLATAHFNLVQTVSHEHHKEANEKKEKHHRFGAAPWPKRAPELSVLLSTFF